MRYDVVVIGSGAGGAPLAARLAEAGRSVCIVEAGGPVRPSSVEEAFDAYYLLKAYTAALGGGGVLSVLAGEALGGTTAINSGTCLEPPDAVLQEWDRGLGTSLAHELPAKVAEVKREISVSTPPHSLLGRSNLLFAEGVRALGGPEPYVLPRNATGCQGVGNCCFGCPTGAKQSTDRVYLPRAALAGATILPFTRAERIVPRADGVRLSLRSKSGEVRHIEARTLVIAAGALGTPRLLQENRLSKRAGQRLTIHPAAKVLAVFPQKVHGGRGVPQGMGMHLPELPRIAFEGIFTPPEAGLPILSGCGVDVEAWLQKHDYSASFGLMVKDRTHGSLSWRLGIPFMSYALHPEDAYDMVRGLVYIGRAFLRAGAERVLLPLMGPPNEFTSEAELLALDASRVEPRRMVGAGFHPLGTAGLGRVVDPTLRLHGVDHVYVCDGSVVPTPLGVNPQLTIMALAHRLADHLLTTAR